MIGMDNVVGGVRLIVCRGARAFNHLFLCSLETVVRDLLEIILLSLSSPMALVSRPNSYKAISLHPS